MYSYRFRISGWWIPFSKLRTASDRMALGIHKRRNWAANHPILSKTLSAHVLNCCMQQHSTSAQQKTFEVLDMFKHLENLILMNSNQAICGSQKFKSFQYLHRVPNLSVVSTKTYKGTKLLNLFHPSDSSSSTRWFTFLKQMTVIIVYPDGSISSTRWFISSIRWFIFLSDQGIVIPERFWPKSFVKSEYLSRRFVRK